MPKVQVVDMQGSPVGEMELNEQIFGIEPNVHVMHSAVVTQLANARLGTHSTLGRSEVRGGGRKPWRQKGTGRARAGMKNSPIWVKGGVTFPPRPRDYSVSFPKKQKRLAFQSAFLLAIEKDGNLMVLKNFQAPEMKTQVVLKMLQQQELLQRKTLIVYDETNGPIFQCLRNVKGITPMHWQSVCTHDIMMHDRFLVTEEALNRLKERLQNA